MFTLPVWIQKIGTEILIVGGIIIISLLYISGVRRRSRQEGRMEKWVENMQAQNEKLTQLQDVRKAFKGKIVDNIGETRIIKPSIEDIENDPDIQNEYIKGMERAVNLGIRGKSSFVWKNPSPVSRD